MSGTNFDAVRNDGGTWFTYCDSRVKDNGEIEYDDPQPGAGRVCVRSIIPFIQERFGKRKRNHEFVFNPKSRSMERVAWFDELTPEQAKAESEDTWDFCITGLENFFMAGEEIPCTKEGKNKLMAIAAFDRFMARCLKTLGKVEADEREEAEKN